MPKILIVDDSKFIRKMISMPLEAAEHEITQAENGQEAFEIFQDHNFDLVITDINMPILGGFGLIEKIRGSSHLRKYIPIIVVSTEFSDDVKERGRRLGVGAWMVKPTDGDSLNEAVNVLIQKYHGDK